jgi:hypothetical protein
MHEVALRRRFKKSGDKIVRPKRVQPKTMSASRENKSCDATVRSQKILISTAKIWRSSARFLYNEALSKSRSGR